MRARSTTRNCSGDIAAAHLLVEKIKAGAIVDGHQVARDLPLAMVWPDDC